MGTWQILVSILLSVILIIVLGIYFFLRPRRTQKYPPSLLEVDQLVPDLTPLNHPNSNPAVHLPDRLEILMEERKRIATATKTTGVSIPGIVSEIKHNLSVATTLQSGKLEPFQTLYWDHNHHNSESVVSAYLEELIQAYTDIRLANIIVGLSKDFGHASQEMEEGYFELCHKIAERLKKIASA